PEPHHVHKVPVPGRPLKGEVVIRSEVPLDHAVQHHCQHDAANGHVETVETGQHKEGGAIDTGSELQVQVTVSMDVLVRLHAHEDRAQQHRRGQPYDGLAAV